MIMKYKHFKLFLCWKALDSLPIDFLSELLYNSCFLSFQRVEQLISKGDCRFRKMCDMPAVNTIEDVISLNKEFFSKKKCLNKELKRLRYRFSHLRKSFMSLSTKSQRWPIYYSLIYRSYVSFRGSDRILVPEKYLSKTKASKLVEISAHVYQLIQRFAWLHIFNPTVLH